MKVAYSAVILDAPSQAKLKSWFQQEVGPPLDRKFSHHMTIAFRPKWDAVQALPLGETVRLKVVGYAEDEKGQAVLVECSVKSSNAHPHIVKSSNAHPHITVTTRQDTSPVYSNELLARGVTRVQGPHLTGRVGFSNGKSVLYNADGDA